MAEGAALLWPELFSAGDFFVPAYQVGTRIEYPRTKGTEFFSRFLAKIILSPNRMNRTLTFNKKRLNGRHNLQNQQLNERNRTKTRCPSQGYNCPHERGGLYGK